MNGEEAIVEICPGWSKKENRMWICGPWWIRRQRRQDRAMQSGVRLAGQQASKPLPERLPTAAVGPRRDGRFHNWHTMPRCRVRRSSNAAAGPLAWHRWNPCRLGAWHARSCCSGNAASRSRNRRARRLQLGPHLRRCIHTATWAFRRAATPSGKWRLQRPEQQRYSWANRRSNAQHAVFAPLACACRKTT